MRDLRKTLGFFILSILSPAFLFLNWFLVPSYAERQYHWYIPIACGFILDFILVIVVMAVVGAFILLFED